MYKNTNYLWHTLSWDWFNIYCTSRYDVIAQIYYARRLAQRLYPMARMVDLHGGHLVSHERTEEVRFACKKCNKSRDPWAVLYRPWIWHFPSPFKVIIFNFHYAWKCKWNQNIANFRLIRLFVIWSRHQKQRWAHMIGLICRRKTLVSILFCIKERHFTLHLSLGLYMSGIFYIVWWVVKEW